MTLIFLGVGKFSQPPAPDALYRKLGRVVIDTDINPAVIGAQVVDAVGRQITQLGIDKVMNPEFFRCALGLFLLNALAVVQLSPDTGTLAPWIARAAGEARNAITSARSDGATQREGSALGMSLRFSGVSMIVGSTQLTLMPFSRSSADIDSVRRASALLEAL